MKKFIIIAAALAPFSPTALVVPVTDCKVLAGENTRDDKDVKFVDLVLPVKGKGVIDFHFSFAGGHARFGGSTIQLAVCKVGEENGKSIMSTVYRVNVEKGQANIAIAGMPEKTTAKVSAVVGGKTYFGTVSSDGGEVTLGEKTSVSWEEDK